jgi:hypothetical protein
MIRSRRSVELSAAATLIGPGLAGGVVTAIVGGASLITFPALLAVGLPPIIANASTTIALAPANLAAAVAHGVGGQSALAGPAARESAQLPQLLARPELALLDVGARAEGPAGAADDGRLQRGVRVEREERLV